MAPLVALGVDTPGADRSHHPGSFRGIAFECDREAGADLSQAHVAMGTPSRREPLEAGIAAQQRSALFQSRNVRPGLGLRQPRLALA